MSYQTVFPCDAILFDLDGTLISSIAAVDRAWGAFCRRHGLDVSFVLPQIHGRRSIDSIRALLPHVDAEAEDAWIREREATDTDGVYALPGVLEFVSSLTCPWTVVTSGTSDVARARLRAAGLPEPPVAVFGEDVKNGKPAPDPFRLGSERLGIPPERCLAFEDTVAGIRSAHAANMKAIALTTSVAVDLLGEADAIVTDFRELRFEPGPRVVVLPKSPF
jgi:sugar-phosphatase